MESTVNVPVHVSWEGEIFGKICVNTKGRQSIFCTICFPNIPYSKHFTRKSMNQFQTEYTCNTSIFHYETLLL